MSRLLLIVFATLVLLTGPAAHAAPGDKPRIEAPRFYAVVFGVRYTPEGDVSQLRLLKVVDPRRGNADAPEVGVPERFVQAAREALATPRMRPKAGEVPQDEVFTYFFFDPARPERADLDPRPRRVR